MRHIAILLTILTTLTGLAAVEPVITGFSIQLIEGGGAFRLVDHTLFFKEGDQAEDSVKLTEEQVGRAIGLLAGNSMLAKKYAAKPVGKPVAIEIHVTRKGVPDDVRYLTVTDGEQLEVELEAKAKANADDPKALAKLDLQGELLPYLFGLAVSGKTRK